MIIDKKAFHYHPYKVCLNFYTGRGDEVVEVSCQVARLLQEYCAILRTLKRKEYDQSSIWYQGEYSVSYEDRTNTVLILRDIEDALKNPTSSPWLLELLLNPDIKLREFGESVVDIVNKRESK